MKISHNQTIFLEEKIKQENQVREGAHKKGERTDFFAGNLNQDLFENKLLQKKKEEQEKAEKLEEKLEEQEAFIEKQKDKREEAEELLESMPMKEMLHMEQLKDEIKQEIKNIVSEMKLVAEDIKGAVVDKNI